MKIAATIARYLLGLVFLAFGLNGFLHFIPVLPPKARWPGSSWAHFSYRTILL